MNLENPLKRKLGEIVDTSTPSARETASTTPKKVKAALLPPPGFANTVLLGDSLQTALSGLKQGTRADSVFTSISMPYAVGGIAQGDDKRLVASFHTNTHWNDESNGREKVWTQGMLSTGKGNTAYFDDGVDQVIPETLRLDRATFEGRAMKGLTAKNGYDVTRKRSEVTGSEKKYVGGIAIASYLEDLTATRGLAIDDVGSAMRAKTMTEKWSMKHKDEEQSEGFGDKMFDAFPQLGGGGATSLWDKLSTDKKQGVATNKNLHLGNAGKIHQAHVLAETAAGMRFQGKFDQLKSIDSGEQARTELGQWWGDNWDTVKPLSETDGNSAATANAYKKRKLERHDIVFDHQAQAPNAHDLPGVPTPMRGQEFLQSIGDLAQGASRHDKEVFATLDLPYLKGSTEEQLSAFNFGTFSTKTWLNEGSPHPWTQGMMEPSQNTKYYGKKKTAYTGAIPNELTPLRATMEGRAMKHLSDESYAFSELPTKQARAANVTQAGHFGDLTMGSFLEDITGKRALGLDDVGSAMRARTMAAKWAMKESGAKGTPSFGKEMLESFPQLGKKEWGDKQHGAANLWKNMQSESKRDGIVTHHTDSIAKAHLKAQQSADQRFTSKFSTFQEIMQDGKVDNKDEALTARLGGWWQKNREDLHNLSQLPQDSVEQHTHAKQQIKSTQEAYTQRKMERHGMSTYDPNTRLQKTSFGK